MVFDSTLVNKLFDSFTLFNCLQLPHFYFRTISNFIFRINFFQYLLLNFNVDLHKISIEQYFFNILMHYLLKISFLFYQKSTKKKNLISQCTSKIATVLPVVNDNLWNDITKIKNVLPPYTFSVVIKNFRIENKISISLVKIILFLLLSIEIDI